MLIDPFGLFFITARTYAQAVPSVRQVPVGRAGEPWSEPVAAILFEPVLLPVFVEVAMPHSFPAEASVLPSVAESSGPVVCARTGNIGSGNVRVVVVPAGRSSI